MIGEQDVYIAISGCRSSNHPGSLQFLRSERGRKPQICRWNCHPVCHSSRDKSISVFGDLVAISGSRSLSQSPGVRFFVLGVVENPIFAVGTIGWNCHPICHTAKDVSISRFGGHFAISGCRSLSQSRGDTLFGLAMVENPGLDDGISTLSVVVPVV